MQLTFLSSNPHIYEKDYTVKLIAILNKLLITDAPDYAELEAFFETFIAHMKTKMSVVTAGRKICYYVIEGNIGSGKSTLLLQNSGASSAAVVVPEPLKYWQGLMMYNEVDGTIFSNIFEQFYEALAREKSCLIMLFQIVALFSRLVYIINSVEQHPTKSCFVSERSFLSDRRIFFEISKHKSTPQEIESYFKCHDMCTDFLQDITESRLFFYFHKAEDDSKQNIETCLTRIRKRNRSGEEGISLPYLAEVEEKTRAFEAGIIDSAKINQETFLKIFCE